ncbi:acetolactate synthase large subunit [uncultured Paracoccus sp.]|uniref:acetolactate synthase large subunit n=1 Tax=uncultured Paracoccus sp. TaxID=189685 RepID=UPI002619EB83|nr:acetolactate synthase large subunit [uncultured Paracoccus sp.]
MSNPNGAERLCDTLLANDIDVCFANPGTSEMHFVAALDRRPQMRCVLGLFEGVVTGAADGYGRMTDRPAATLLHLGPGLANGLANLHNARRARTPIVNVVGDHATYHLPYDAPLTSDVESLARPMSDWVGRADKPDTVVDVASEACRAALERSGISTLILAADAAWGAAPDGPIHRVQPAPRPSVEQHDVDEAAEAIRSGNRVVLLLGGRALRAEPLEVAGRIAAVTDAEMMAENFNQRIERGAGRTPIRKLAYPIDATIAALADVDTLILIGAQRPVGFFAYPGKPSDLVPKQCRVVELARPLDDLKGALDLLADAVDASARPPTHQSIQETSPQAIALSGVLTADTACRIVAAMVPEHAIICDESVTSGRSFYAHSEAAPPHDYLQLTGGSIGIGMPLGAGAAIACPDRRVICLQADGSGMYTVQALWTHAREGLNVTTVIFSNRAYAILQAEMKNVGVGQHGRNADRMLQIDDPALDWVSIARGMGVEAIRAETAEDLTSALSASFGQSGPFLIEVVL